MRTRNTWFDLSRHEGETDPPADPPADSAETPADPGTGDGKDLEAEVKKWRDMARKSEERAKSNADKAKRLDALEESQKSDAEKLTAAREAAEKRATVATARAVRAEVKAAAGEFADPTDTDLLGDLSKYVDDAGEIDSEAITADLAALLEQKPHLRKAAPGRPGPRPDPSQGGGRDAGPVDFNKAEPAAFAAELAKYGLRAQSRS